MPTPITETTVSFTYNIADKLYATTTSLNRTANASYTGPDRIWQFVDNDTGVISREQPPLTSEDDGADVPVPEGLRKVEVVAADDPVIISIIREYNVTYADTTTTTDTLPDGSECTYETTATLGQTYDLDGLVHNGTEWVLGSMIETYVTWDQIIDARNGALTATDGKISPDQPASIKQPWIDYRQALRDLPVTFGYGTDNEIEAWKVNMPDHPED